MDGAAITLISAGALFVAAVMGTLPLIAAGNVLGFFRFGAQSLRTSSRSLPSRKRAWGTVYDSRTMRPLPYAHVRLIGKDNRILEQRVSDQQGRYAFLTTPESLQATDVNVRLEVEHPDYSFPSHVQPGAADSFLYGNLYYGKLITVDAGVPVTPDIPMDARRRGAAMPGRGAPSIGVGLAVAAMADVTFWIGLIAVPLAYVLQPNPFTLGFVFLYLGTVSLRVFGVAERPFGVVTDGETGYAMPFALVSLEDADGKRIAHAVSDERGRYVLPVEKGEYTVTVRTPANVQPTRTKRQAVSARKGWLAEKISL